MTTASIATSRSVIGQGTLDRGPVWPSRRGAARTTVAAWASRRHHRRSAAGRRGCPEATGGSRRARPCGSPVDRRCRSGGRWRLRRANVAAIPDVPSATAFRRTPPASSTVTDTSPDVALLGRPTTTPVAVRMRPSVASPRPATDGGRARERGGPLDAQAADGRADLAAGRTDRRGHRGSHRRCPRMGRSASSGNRTMIPAGRIDDGNEPRTADPAELGADRSVQLDGRPDLAGPDVGDGRAGGRRRGGRRRRWRRRRGR